MIGIQTYHLTRSRWPAAQVNYQHSTTLVVAAAFGALVGARILAWLEWPQEFWRHKDNWMILLSGKTIVGGLLGGWAASWLI